MEFICSESASPIGDDTAIARKPTRGKKFRACSFENQEDEFIKVRIQNCVEALKIVDGNDNSS